MNRVEFLLNYLNHFRWLPLALLTVILVLSVACGSGDDSKVSGGSTESGPDVGDALSQVARVMLEDRTFTADDYVAAGWKRSKKFDDISTVPEATEVYFGFYDAKDVELRIYASHDSAASVGANDAAANIAESDGWAARPGAGLGTLQFDAFVVAGNTVLLCEFLIDVCVGLATAVGG
jgi:hypothetical protein